MSRKPEDGKFRTNISVQIKPFFTVIPPFSSEKPFHKPTSHIFQKRAQNHTAQKQEKKLVFQILQKNMIPPSG